MNFEAIYNFLLSQRYRFNSVSQEDFQDLVHDTMVKIIDRSHLYKPEYPETLWANIILKNEYINRLRRSKYKKNGATQAYNFYELKENLLVSDENIYDQLELKQFRLHISRIPATKTRRIFQMRCQGYKLREIAQELKVNINTVKSIIAREITNIRSQLYNQILINF